MSTQYATGGSGLWDNLILNECSTASLPEEYLRTFFDAFKWRKRRFEPHECNRFIHEWEEHRISLEASQINTCFNAAFSGPLEMAERCIAESGASAVFLAGLSLQNKHLAGRIAELCRKHNLPAPCSSRRLFPGQNPYV